MTKGALRCVLLVFVFIDGFVLSSSQSTDLPKVWPEKNCVANGLYFDATLQRCMSCETIDQSAVLAVGSSAGQEADITDIQKVEELGSRQCKCSAGLVQCFGGDTCLAGSAAGLSGSNASSAFTAQGQFQCRACPNAANGQPMAPTQDKTSCLPCLVSASDPASTTGYSDQWGDCLCPQGYALEERGQDGSYLPAKRCVKCSSGILSSSSTEQVPLYDCNPCEDPVRKYRIAETGQCVCREGSYIAAGGACVSSQEYNEVNDIYPVASAIRVKFRDLIDGKEDFWQGGPFGNYLGIEIRGQSTTGILSPEASSGQTMTVSSAVVDWLYMRCAVDCIRGNATACQCISNLCVLLVYDDESTVCQLLTNKLYAGKPNLVLSRNGAEGVEGMPWLYYQSQMPSQILKDSSLGWTYTFSKDGGGRSDATGTLVFWLASYSLEGAWRGWQKVESQLDLCAALGGTSLRARSPPSTWRRFGSSVRMECQVLVSSVLSCGASPMFYDLFIEDRDGSLLPVPVRILNHWRDKQRPNLNTEIEDAKNDILVRRFTMCDSISGRESGPDGSGEAYLSSSSGYSRAVRWAAHAAVQVRVRPSTGASDDGKVYMPVLSLAYADKRTDSLIEGDSVPVTFTAEYSMDTEGYWTTVTVLFVVPTLIGALVLTCWRIYLLNERYPNLSTPMGFADPHLFVPRWALQLLVFCSTTYSVFFWFHFSMAFYWVVTFKLQDVPHLLLPSAMDGNQYETHDVMMVFLFCMGVFTVSLGLWKKLRVFIFLVDWEKPKDENATRALMQPAPPPPGSLSASLNAQMSGQFQPGLMQQQFNPNPQAGSFAAGAAAAAAAASGQMVGSPLLNSPPGTAAAGGFSNVMQGESVPDTGISAWRSLFICNELNERLTCTRTVPVVTWLAMALLLEGFSWKNTARWYHGSTEALATAQYNPFLQFALANLVWIFVIAAQLILQRIGSIWLGHDLNDFIDACSVANMSVFVLDEPFHGHYIHGKAPSSRGDWSHTELAKVLHDEDKGIGFSRGLTPDACQTFEMFLPPDMAVMLPSGNVAHFRQSLSKVFAEVQQTKSIIYSRRPEKPTAADVAQMSYHRLSVQSLVDAMVHAVMRGAGDGDVLQERRSWDWFWGAPPQGGVAAQTHPVFYKDQDGLSFPNGLAWSQALAYGGELRVAGVGIPTGFEWHLALLELLLFNLCWRFQGSIYFSAGLAYLLNILVLSFLSAVGRSRLAQTAIIDDMFLI
mmetsp:Transcript_52478/g.94064  ORF Transcript_52478/g.94064 Transcript_52478/m.94064 type:complete len:1236 (+) Transcript_52478:88-3795(+)